jgi:acyl-coenzyme A thioesterase PaaI-like protein
VRASFKAEQDLQGYEGILHGGVIAALLDAGMTHCLFRRQIKAVTGDLHVRYLHQVNCGEELQVRAWILSGNPPLFLLKSELTAAGRVLAWAEAKFVVPRSAQDVLRR